MKFEVIQLQGVQVIGVAKEIELSKGATECPKCWAEFCERFSLPMQPGATPTAQQQAIMSNCIGEYALCFCDYEKGTFLYVIAGTYRGGEVPDGMALYNFPDGQWLRFEFEGGMSAFHQQYVEVYEQWLPAHPEYVIRQDVNAEWYEGMDITSPDYRNGIMIPLR